ncbi:hypothetical protein RRG08_054929, partial [Elysia crispata]
MRERLRFNHVAFVPAADWSSYAQSPFAKRIQNSITDTLHQSSRIELGRGRTQLFTKTLATLIVNRNRKFKNLGYQ